jgi:hypothetical protein
MKTILYDYSNDGILYVGDSLPVANHLKRGLVDVEMRIMLTWNTGYKKVTKDDILNNNQHFQLTRDNDVFELPELARNEIYLERIRLVKLRANLMERLMYWTWAITGKSRISPWDGFENTIEYIITESSPDTEVWHDSLLEYAHIHSVSPAVAYRELKLQMDTLINLKMRSFANMNLFSEKINKVTREDQVKPLMEEIMNRFWRDAWI